MSKPIASRRQKQRGISLLETISVVTIAGSLSAVAVPKLANLPSQARLSVISSMEGAVFSASSLMHMKCAVEATCHLSTGESTLQSFSDSIKMVRGYPAGGHDEGIQSALDFKGFTAKHSANQTLFAKHGAVDPETCAVVYNTPLADGLPPTITTLTSGC